jgi:serine/threonine protein kinase
MEGRTLGHYRIEAKLGEGGMGVVYRARDLHLDRPVAIKVLSAEAVSHADRRRRFVQEAKAASALNHPNILHVYDIDSQDGVDFIAMEYVEGQTLSQRIAGRGVPLEEALKYAVQIADALAVAHAAGIVHRDIKPANLMVNEKGLVKVLDFGLATLAGGSQESGTGDATATQGLTREGTIVGTAAYMSPEQAEGKKVDSRSDIFSFGAVLYEMVTGRRAFQGESKIATLSAILHQEPPPLRDLLPSVPADLERIISHCLRKDPARRFQHLDDVKTLLEELKDESRSGKITMTTSVILPRPSGARRRKRAIALAATLLVVVAAAVAYRLFRHRPQGQTSDAPRALTRLTFQGGLQSEPTWSPDGRLIAYSSDRSGNFDIWVQQVDGSNPVQVTTNGAHDWQPAWSPDGNRIAFRSEREGGGLYIVPALGGHERRIASFGYRPQWSPDGSLLLFQSTVLRGVTETPRFWVTSLEGSPREQFQGFSRTFRAAWHPDGKRVSLAGVRQGEPSSAFWTVGVDGGGAVKSEVAPEVQRRLRDASLAPSGYFQWALSGTALYFEGASRGVQNLWKIVVDPKTLAWVGGPERLTTGPGMETDLTVSADGRKLAFTTRLETTRLWSLPFDAATGRLRGEGAAITEAGKVVLLPDLSRDGKKLAYVARRGDQQELWQKSLEDGEEILLAADSLIRFAPRWSWDGTRLGYDRRRLGAPGRPPERGIYYMPAGGGSETQVTTSGVGTMTDWSPDGGAVLAFCRSKAGRIEICLVPLSAAPRGESQARVLAADPKHNLWQGRFSPNGRWISFTAASEEGGNVSTIYVMAASGGPRTQITEGDHWDDKPRWSPDGRTLYFICNRGGFLNVWGRRFDPDGGQAVSESFRVTNLDSPGRMIFPHIGTLEITLSRDRLIVPITEVSGSVWMLDGVDR